MSAEPSPPPGGDRARPRAAGGRDNPYGLLRYEGGALDPLYKLEGGDYVLYLGTFSKILSPGIRLGWLCAPPR